MGKGERYGRHAHYWIEWVLTCRGLLRKMTALGISIRLTCNPEALAEVERLRAYKQKKH